ncbi:mrna export factor elf1 [Ceraceosorus bombacis]|uniref:Elongation factor 3 n=1 Tax=Ceraceosorus bombacis TaxID=401625 RepID=A0A0P1BMP6_9BASI|nr:mrna export factor elf1 [Ceraceosorus bombacis]
MSPTATTNGAGASASVDALLKAPDASSAAQAAEALASHVNEHGFRTLDSENILASLLTATRSKKSATDRENAAIGLGALFVKVGGKNAPTPLGAEPWFLGSLTPLLELYADKVDSVKKAAESAVGSLLVLAPAEATPELLQNLYGTIESSASKWQSKVGALKRISKLADAFPEQIGEQLEELIPHLKNAMSDTKSEVSKQAVKTTTKVCGVIDNNDIRPHLGSLVEAMRAPDTVPECIKRLSSTTFVAEVTGPALAIMVPLLVRALNEKNSTVQRSASIIVENLTKLVREPHTAVRFLPSLKPGVERIAQGAAFPEVRQLAGSALRTLDEATKAVGEAKEEEDPTKAFAAAKDAAAGRINVALVGHLPSEYADVNADSWAQTGIRYLAALIARLSDKRVVASSAWNEAYVLPYLRRITASQESAQAVTDTLRTQYIKIDEERFGAPEEDDEEISGECLVNIQFSLAYGGLLLLNHTKLRLHRGHRYGIVATNGSGKSTLLKAMRDGKVENFPTEADGVRTVMVEHNQGDGAGEKIVNYVHSDPGVQKAGKSKDDTHKALADVGFDEERRNNGVESLSGGWKMKLALARAMLTGADILLLDEPTNHLDVASVKWLQDYLVSNTNVTVLTVSHDSGFLDSVCTDIMHYENKKIKYYKGNLSDFVGKKPEAKSYYSLAATSIKFSFPPTGALAGHHLEKTAVEYIMWRFDGGMDKEILELATRRISDEEREQLEKPIVSKEGVSRIVERIVGRQKQRRTFNYEIKWRGLQHKDNSWVSRDRLTELGFGKLVQRFDDEVAAREGAGSKDLNSVAVRKLLEDVGLNPAIAEHNEMRGLSGGQKVKVVLAASLWNNPNILILDEPTNFLDREALGGLSVAIREWSGAVVIISHNMQFVDALCNEIVTVEGDEGAGGNDLGFKEKKKKTKLTRAEQKAQAERRKKRLNDWLIYGGAREPDTDDEKDDVKGDLKKAADRAMVKGKK